MPIIVLSGDSLYQKKLLIDSYKSADSKYIKIYSDDTDKLKIIENSIKNVGLFSKRWLIDIVDYDNWKSGDKKLLLELLNNVPEYVYIFLQSSNCLKNFECKSFNLPKPWEIEKWILYIESFMKNKNLNYDENVPKILWEYIGPNELSLHNEIEKLSIINKKITVDDVEKLVHKLASTRLDEFCFALTEKNNEIYRYIKSILNEYEPLVVTAALARHFIDLLHIISNVELKDKYSWKEITSISRNLKIQPSRVARFLGFKFKTQKISPINHLKIYDYKKIRETIISLYKMERLLKTGAISEVELIDFVKNFSEEE
ncbi:hypothetical protein JYK00_00945 [Thermosipho ferrireducens]|uniref:DNA polymerase III, delta subunit n=1 Tax=Thermosipho ferrireducens TaxID=2571116 RepID=A0ABX7S6D0_9BACT|nr:hypothetical protein [Thermosipho ferrireducens]QTA38142.1 hypothetical protein JYK00_00945 [Thermosipho ferrireducens]